MQFLELQKGPTVPKQFVQVLEGRRQVETPTQSHLNLFDVNPAVVKFLVG